MSHRHLNEDQFPDQPEHNDPRDDDYDDSGEPSGGIGGFADMKGDWEKSFTGTGVKYSHPAHPGRTFTSDEYMERTRHQPFDTSGGL
jgi:hypothetical protein